MTKGWELAGRVKPTNRQLAWQETEFYALISYGLPVFTGKQYGDGFAPPSMFWPEDMNVDSWCRTVKAAGMNGIVFTCKHYDGFCLWPTKMTDYSIANSNWLDGEGDLVRLVSSACRRHGLKFGIYISPWDRHEKSYGKGKAYDDFFCGCLEELLTSYGDVFCVWLDGQIGANEIKKQDHDWSRYYKLIRELAPEAVISFRGPDVRWCGNESGHTRNEEWSVVPAYLGVLDDGSELPCTHKKSVNLLSNDIGGRKTIKDDEFFIWYPNEVSVPMRSHWFYDEEDKYSVKTKDKLLNLYFRTVGNNSALMLGLSPNKRGVLDETDTQILTALGYDLKIYFGYNLLTNAKIDASSSFSDDCKPEYSKSITDSECWRPALTDKKPVLSIQLNNEELFDKIVLCERILNGQHIEEFEIQVLNEKKKWKTVYSGTTVGYKKICCIDPVRTDQLRIVFKSFRGFFELNKLQLN